MILVRIGREKLEELYNKIEGIHVFWGLLFAAVIGGGIHYSMLRQKQTIEKKRRRRRNKRRETRGRNRFLQILLEWWKRIRTPKSNQEKQPPKSTDAQGTPPRLKCGGGETKRVCIRQEKLNPRQGPHVPITICDWGNWLYEGSCMKLDKEIDVLAGGAKAPGTIKTYSICFKRWAHFRDLQNKNFIIDPKDDQQEAELDLLRFAALQFGPLQKSAATINLYFKAIVYVHKVQTGVNPCENMQRVKLMLQGATRQDGPPKRKLPISVEDLLTIKRITDPDNVDETILMCVILIGWYFMLRKSEYLGPGMKGVGPKNYRFSIRMMDLEPHRGLQKVEWGGVSIRFHCTFTVAKPTGSTVGPFGPTACSPRDTQMSQFALSKT